MSGETRSILEDEIDLREILHTLWKARLVILILTLAAAIAAFAVNSWLLPHQYRSSAFVFIGSPAITTSSKSASFSISPTLPDLKAVVQLATAPSLLEGVIKDPAAVKAIQNETIVITEMASAIDVGKDQLRLTITDTDPERAALLANLWAEKIAATINTTYGVDALATNLDTQIIQARQDYEQAQENLSKALSTSPMDALSAQLERNQMDLKCILNNRSVTGQVLIDMQVLESGWKKMPGDSKLPLGDGLALTTLRQRALASQPCRFIEMDSRVLFTNNTSVMPAQNDAPSMTVQLESGSFSDVSASEALATAALMRETLQVQLKYMEDEETRIEQEIPLLQSDLANAQAQLNHYTTHRDLSYSLYATLLEEQQQIATVLSQSAKVATISVKAMPSKNASSPNIPMNTAVFGALGFIIASLAALAVEAWKAGGKSG